VYPGASYVIDPVVRRAMGIELDDAVVIFDEAHNIEDVAREAGSLELTAEKLRGAQVAFALLADAGVLPDVHRPLSLAMDRVVAWLHTAGNGHTMQVSCT
jgi:Fanconi anemia group J protein